MRPSSLTRMDNVAPQGCWNEQSFVALQIMPSNLSEVKSKRHLLSPILNRQLSSWNELVKSDDDVPRGLRCWGMLPGGLNVEITQAGTLVEYLAHQQVWRAHVPSKWSTLNHKAHLVRNIINVLPLLAAADVAVMHTYIYPELLTKCSQHMVR